MDKELQLMKELTEAAGPPGFEVRVHRLMKEKLSALTQEIITDNLGSIVGQHGNAGPKILLAAHMDEVAFMVTHITKEGFLRLQPLGGWWGHVMLAQRVKVLSRKGDLTGVIGSKAPHILSIEERKNVLEISNMFVDIGATSKEEAEEFGVEVGDPIIPICPFEVLPNPKMLLAKAWDNRAGCFVTLQVFKQICQESHPNTVFCGATVQEEVGLRGAVTLSHKVSPDIAFALDVGVAGDTPGMSHKEGHSKLGAGPLLGFYDSSMIPHLNLRDFVIDTAKENKIPYQTDIMPGGGTDAGKIHMAHNGVPSMVISVPARYIHSHVSIVHRDDLDNAVKLLVSLIKKLDEETVGKIKGMDDRGR
ncbi:MULTISPECIES: M42 family metallopeptidase [Brevibacillus]|jgi:endoglucanase|uniref:M42 family metallopeptidase n=1 Tax=Brevibacillus TaxID=55080 RepID=UPI00046A7AF6|nr:M42 family metallopeptidase [Brevibacillus borstelensis]MBE5396415.1 M42 family metallopeptidase [Brevibacillus borstelensis]MCC0565702.1 M42 family metallopeptidase [Brevibacillus borstelensis]MCM3472491.1 M42 family metallopeptidase [Brevibacillus borstelensis]MCM3560512.1 M42 family metallopeptidase [Brevibacillus borstelensis]MCM3593144.1 M42 family metallopeptidase [Brevibacillus borstelensis]